MDCTGSQILNCYTNIQESTVVEFGDIIMLTRNLQYLLSGFTIRQGIVRRIFSIYRTGHLERFYNFKWLWNVVKRESTELLEACGRIHDLLSRICLVVCQN